MTGLTMCALLCLTACTSSGDDEPPVAPVATAPAPAAAPTADAPTPSPAPTLAPVGTRENPLPIGETAKIEPTSGWYLTVNSSNLDAPSKGDAAAADETFVVANVTITADGPAIEAQGGDVGGGIDAAGSVTVEYVTADGRSYTGASGTYCYTDTMLLDNGPIYQDGASVTGDVCIAVPSADVAGGLWRLSNLKGTGLWVASS